MPSKYKQRPRDTARMLWIKSLPCCAQDVMLPLEHVGPCDGPVEADHAGGSSGMGRKADDSTVISLCVRHHRAPGLEHLLSGKVPHGYVREWKREQVRKAQAAYAARQEANRG